MMDRLKESTLRAPLGDRFSIPKYTAQLTGFDVPTPSIGSSPSNAGGMMGLMPFFVGGPMGPMSGFPPFMSFNLASLPPGVNFGAPVMGPPPTEYTAGGGGGTGGRGETTNNTDPDYRPRWPQNNVFIAEIRGWERAVAPPTSSTAPDYFKWIWKYKWQELGTNNIWDNYSTRSWESNPGIGDGNSIYAFNGCEYPNHAGDDTELSGRRTFIGPFARNLVEPTSTYLPYSSSAGLAPQAWQDFSMFTDLVGAPNLDRSLPLWNDDRTAPEAIIGQPLPIGHHKRAFNEGDWDYHVPHSDWADAPNVVVLMMERWQKVSGISNLGGPTWCPDCSAGGNTSQHIAFGDEDYVCSYWFYATNSRLDLPWVPAQSAMVSSNNYHLHISGNSTNSNTPQIPYYNWVVHT